ncbi:acyltransferase, partial [Corallococcus coralloides]|nr:acyltransferase [Corallococcus coralloides]
LCGRLTRITVQVNLMPVAEELHGDYVNDKNFKRRFQRWLNELWQEKDARLTEMLQRQEK